jgi:5-deoxy-glucuronate isomerase
MTELVVPAADPVADGAITVVTPESAGWGHVGFEALVLAPGATAERDTGDRECCIVVVGGHVHVASEHGDWRDLGGRPTPFAGAPDAAYLPPRTRFTVTGAGAGGEVGLCFAPARVGAEPRVLPASGVTPEARGHGAHARTVNAILMGDEPADALLVCEVYTPPGHWSSYPPHKHDRDAMPDESLLEETYYFRIDPPQGFALQRVYTDDRSLDETLSVADRDTVLVPRGYHTVSAPPGYAAYYLNVMAGPTRAWAVANDPAHAWTLEPR